MLLDRRCELPEQFDRLAEDLSAEKSIHPQNRMHAVADGQAGAPLWVSTWLLCGSNATDWNRPFAVDRAASTDVI